MARAATAASLALVVATSASAHEDGTTGITVSPDHLPPGSPLPIVGQDFGPGEVLDIVLTGPGITRTLAAVPTDAEGHFTVVLEVPPAAQAGPYTVDAVSRSGIIQRALFTVDPAAPAPAVTVSPIAVAGPAADGSPGVSTPVIALIAVAVGIVVALAVGFALRGRQRSGSQQTRSARRAP